MIPHPKSPAPIKLKPAQLKELKMAIWGRDRGCCQLCYRQCIAPEYHHVIFRSQGGGDTVDNILTLCFDCHIRGIHGGGKDAQRLREKAVESMAKINLRHIKKDDVSD